MLLCVWHIQTYWPSCQCPRDVVDKSWKHWKCIQLCFLVQRCELHLSCLINSVTPSICVTCPWSSTTSLPLTSVSGSISRTSSLACLVNHYNLSAKLGPCDVGRCLFAAIHIYWHLPTKMRKSGYCLSRGYCCSAPVPMMGQFYAWGLLKVHVICVIPLCRVTSCQVNSHCVLHDRLGNLFPMQAKKCRIFCRAVYVAHDSLCCALKNCAKSNNDKEMTADDALRRSV